MLLEKTETKVFHPVGNQWNSQLGYFSPDFLEFTIRNLDHSFFFFLIRVLGICAVSVSKGTEPSEPMVKNTSVAPKRETSKLICYYSIILSTGLLSPRNYSCQTVKINGFAKTGLAVCSYCDTEAIKLLKYS